MKALFRLGVAAGVLVAAQAAAGVPVHAQSLDAFFKAQPFTILVGYPPGAGYDMYARLIARHIGQYLPGTPKVVVQNMPGAGQPDRGQSPLQCRQAGRVGHRHVLARHDDAAR